MIDIPLLLLIVFACLACFAVGVALGKFLSVNDKDKPVEPCETIDDILKREG